VLSGTIDTLERLFVEQNLELVTMGDSMQDIHGQQVVIDGDHGFFIDRGQFELSRSDFIMASLGRNTELVQFIFALTHSSEDTRRNLTKVMVLKLLVAGWQTSNQGTAGDLKIRAKSVKTTINQKVFLLSSKTSMDLIDASV
jgi:hypothetical protein